MNDYSPIGDVKAWEYWNTVVGLIAIIIGGGFGFLKFAVPSLFDASRLSIRVLDKQPDVPPAEIRSKGANGTVVRHAYFLHVEVKNAKKFSYAAKKVVLEIIQINAIKTVGHFPQIDPLLQRPVRCAWVPREMHESFKELSRNESALADGLAIEKEQGLLLWLQDMPFNLESALKETDRVQIEFQARSGASLSNKVTVELNTLAEWSNSRKETFENYDLRVIDNLK